MKTYLIFITFLYTPLIIAQKLIPTTPQDVLYEYCSWNLKNKPEYTLNSQKNIDLWIESLNNLNLLTKEYINRKKFIYKEAKEKYDLNKTIKKSSQIFSNDKFDCIACTQGFLSKILIEQPTFKNDRLATISIEQWVEPLFYFGKKVNIHKQNMREMMSNTIDFFNDNTSRQDGKYFIEMVNLDGFWKINTVRYVKCNNNYY